MEELKEAAQPVGANMSRNCEFCNTIYFMEKRRRTIVFVSYAPMDKL